MEAGCDYQGPTTVPCLVPLAWAELSSRLAKPAHVCDRAVLYLFQDSPIPNLTLSQDTERMAWTTG